MHFQEEKMENLKFYVDQNAPKTKFDHYWEKCVGACHAYTALREDYRMMLRKAKKDLGFQYVRFHGLFNDQMSVVREVEPGKYEYNFVNIDNIFDTFTKQWAYHGMTWYNTAWKGLTLWHLKIKWTN